MRKRKGWCDEQDVAHAWKSPESNQYTHNPYAFTHETRVCENCGRFEIRPLVIHMAEPWTESTR